MSDQKEAPWVLAAKTGKIGFANRLGRGDRSPLGVWFWELDRVLLSLMMVLLKLVRTLMIEPLILLRRLQQSNLNVLLLPLQSVLLPFSQIVRLRMAAIQVLIIRSRTAILLFGPS